MRWRACIGSAGLALLLVLSGTSASVAAGQSPFAGLFGRRPAAPEPMNLLPPPAAATPAAGAAPAARPAAAAPKRAARSPARRKAAARRGKPVARLPRPRPQGLAGQSGPVPAAADAAASDMSPKPGPPAQPNAEQPGAPMVVAETAPRPVYPEILVPDFDRLKAGALAPPEPRITGSVRSVDTPASAPQPEPRPDAAQPAAGRVVPPAARAPERGAALSPDERHDRATQKPAAVADLEAEVSGEPYELVRSLQALQDQIARGSTAAFEAQRNLITEIDRKFASAEPEIWQEPRNAYALVTYVLSGGPPTVLSRLLLAGGFPAADEKLMRGALAYVEGRAPEAREHLAEIDARALPGSMGAQVALAQAALSVAADPAKALSQLDTARLLAPGTLVEEAALRREILVASEVGDIAKFQLLARQYLSRFRHSVYAGNFRQRFAAALSRMDFTNDEGQFPRLDELLGSLEPEAQLEVYLTVARASAVGGKLVAARLASDRALALAKPGAADGARAKLYRGSALVVTPGGLAATLDDLQAIDTTVLTEPDRALFNAVSLTATSIQTAADRVPLPDASDGQETAPADPETEDRTAPVVSRARAALAAVDTLLEGAPQ